MYPTTKGFKIEVLLEVQIKRFQNQRVFKSFENVSKSMLQKTKWSIEVDFLAFRVHCFILHTFRHP